MKISFLKLIPSLLGSFALTALPAHAALITGQINIQGGSVVLNPNALGAVLSVGGSTNGVVTSTAGSYPAALIGDVVTYKSFNVVLGAQSISNFWSVTDTLVPVGTGFNYAFDLGAITSLIQTPTNLILNGTGTLKSSNPGLDPTAGLWSYGINSADGTATNGIFSFQSNNATANPANPAPGVPDGGDAVVLFGAALLGLTGFSRKFSWTA